MEENCSVVKGRLESEDIKNLEAPVNDEEVFFAVKGLACNKTPGKDGLPAKFYNKLWHVIGKQVCEVIRFAYNKGRMSRSMAEGVITLIPKVGDKRELRDWRPISLLNSDYKVLSKVISNRLRDVAAKIIQDHQVCAVPDRRIVDNLILLRDMIYFANSHNSPLIVESIDLEKAFDRVSHAFLLQVLRSMGLPVPMIKAIKGLYNNISSQVLVNGNLSEPFLIKSGVRQPCPLSPLAFISVVEASITKDSRGLRSQGVYDTRKP